MRLIWTPGARLQLRAIGLYIAEDSPLAAARVVRKIRLGIEPLLIFPECGRPGRIADTRELIIPGTHYIVPYTVVGKKIFVLAVFHHAEQWPSEFD